MGERADSSPLVTVEWTIIKVTVGEELDCEEVSSPVLLINDTAKWQTIAKR